MLNVQCRALKRDGRPCSLSANSPDGYCWAHSPQNAEQRKKAAAKGGRAKPTAEVVLLKAEIKSVIAEVRSGALDRNNAAVMIQGYRTLKDYVELERRLTETDQLATEIEQLKQEMGYDYRPSS